MQPITGDTQDAPPIGSAAFWKQPFRYETTGDPDTDTARTVAVMCKDIHDSARAANFQAVTNGALRQFSNLAAESVEGFERVFGASFFWWLKHYCRFVHHELLIRRFIGEAGHLQGLISPEVWVQQRRPEGDCAIYTMCAAAMLEVMGVPWEIVTVKVSKREPREYSHVYLYVVCEDGSRFPIDASHGDYPGWQVPSCDINWNENITLSPALQVWDSNGQKTEDRGSRFSGLHNYAMRHGFGALVCCDELGNYYDDGTGTTTSTPPSNPPIISTFPTPCTCLPNGTCQEDGNSCSYSGGFITPSGAPYSGPTYTAPSQSNTAAWANFAAAMGKAGFTLAQLNAIQPGTVLSANGAILRQAPGLPVPGTSFSSSLSTLGGSSSSILMLGGLGLLALLLIGGRR